MLTVMKGERLWTWKGRLLTEKKKHLKKDVCYELILEKIPIGINSDLDWGLGLTCYEQ